MRSPARLPLTGLPVAGTGRRSALLAGWSTAWLQGRAAADDALAAVTGTDEPHLVDGLDRGELLTDLFADLRARGAGGLRLVLPVPGDPRGLPAPSAAGAAAMEQGEAVTVQLTDPSATEGGYALVPYVTPQGSDLDGFATVVRWRVLSAPPALPDPPGTLRAVERELTEALRDAAQALAQLDVARLSPAAAEALGELRELTRHGRPVVALPRAHPVAAQTLLAQADRLAIVLDIAGGDDGGAVDLGSAHRRREVLRTFASAVRRARVAAVNAPLDPTG